MIEALKQVDLKQDELDALPKNDSWKCAVERVAEHGA